MYISPSIKPPFIHSLLRRNIRELSQVKPATAMHYCFYTFTSAPAPSSAQAEPALLNATAAYTELMKQGCSLATEEWVTNHWCLILWKLAGMAALEPGSEKVESKRRWCWAEVVKQLRRR
jgi:breast cancer 2 susceptibility protein